MKRMIKIPLILIVVGSLLYLAGVLLDKYADQTQTVTPTQP